MRISLNLDDKTHAYLKEYARLRGLTLGGAVDEHVRKLMADPAILPELSQLRNKAANTPPRSDAITPEPPAALSCRKATSTPAETEAQPAESSRPAT